MSTRGRRTPSPLPSGEGSIHRNLINSISLGVRAIPWSFVIFFISLFVLILLLRIQVLLDPLGRDQGIFSYVAMCLKHGLLPYKDVLDHKPPLIFYLYQLLYTFFPTGKITLFVFDTIYIFIFSILFGKFVNKYLFKNSFILSTLLFVFMFCTESIYEGGNLTEHYMIFFQFIFYIFLWRYFIDHVSAASSKKTRHSQLATRNLFLAGLSLGIAALWKPVAFTSLGVALITFIFVLITERRLLKTIISGIVFLAGLATPHLLLFFYYSHLGIWGHYIFGSYLFDLSFLHRSTPSITFVFSDFINLIKEQYASFLFVWVTFAIFIVMAIKNTSLIRNNWRFLCFWLFALICELIGAFSSIRFLGHYFIQALIPTTILVIFIWKQLKPRQEHRIYRWIIIFLLIIAVITQGVKAVTAPMRHPIDYDQAIGLYIKERTAPTDTIYVNGVSTGIYVFAERSAPWRYVHDFFIRNVSNSVRDQECRSMLNKHPRYIVLTSTIIFPEVQKYLTRSYHLEKEMYKIKIYRIDHP